MDLTEALEIERDLRSYLTPDSGNVFRPDSGPTFKALLLIIDNLRDAVAPHETPGEFIAVADAYHALLPSLPKVSILGNARKLKIKKRWEEHTKGQPKANRPSMSDWWMTTFSYAAQSEFLTGARANDRGWRPNLDFFLQPASLTKLLEGVYHNKQSGSKHSIWDT